LLREIKIKFEKFGLFHFRRGVRKFLLILELACSKRGFEGRETQKALIEKKEKEFF